MDEGGVRGGRGLGCADGPYRNNRLLRSALNAPSSHKNKTPPESSTPEALDTHSRKGIKPLSPHYFERTTAWALEKNSPVAWMK